MLPLQPPVRIRKEIRTEGLGHLLHDRFELTVAGDEMDLVGLRVLHQLLVGKCPADNKTVRRLVVIFLIQGHGFRRPAEMVLQPPEDRLMLLRNGLDDLDLAFFGNPFDGLGLDPVESFLGKRWQGEDATRLPSVIEAPAQTVHDIQLPFAFPLDVVQQLAKGIVADLMKIEGMLLEPGDKVVIGGIQVIPVRGGGKMRLLKLDPLLQVFGV